MDLGAVLFRLQHHPKDVTSLEKYGICAKIHTEEEAHAHLRACADHARLLRPEMSWTEAFVIERVKIGYFAGYCDIPVRLRIERLYQCVHPYAGAAHAHGTRQVQLSADFDAMCRVWDTQPYGTHAFGAHRQPTWGHAAV